jgi:hypothetical protein
MSGILVEAASLQKDSTYFFQKLSAVLPSSANATVRAAIQWNLGRVWLAQKQEEKAKAAFHASVDSATDSAPGRRAERQLYELLRLGAGQAAPLFSATAIKHCSIDWHEVFGRQKRASMEDAENINLLQIQKHGSLC